MSTNNGRTIKIIGLVISGAVLVAGGVGSGYKAISDSKEYTDTSVKELRIEQTQKMDKLAEDLSEVKQDVAVVRTILEERFGKHRGRADTH